LGDLLATQINKKKFNFHTLLPGKTFQSNTISASLGSIQPRFS